MLGLGLDLAYKMGSGIQSVNTLANGLAAFWELNETSGTRYDSHASYDLTEVNNVDAGAGVIDGAADFNFDWLVSNTTFNLASAGFSVSTWLNGDATNIGPAVGQWQFGFGFLIGIDSTYFGNNEITFVLGNEPTYYTAKYPNSPGWHHVVATYDPTLGISKLYVDGVLRDTITSIPSIPLDGSANFKMGTIDNGGEFTYDGLIDSTALWLRPLTQQEVIDLYNDGDGLPYNQINSIATLTTLINLDSSIENYRLTAIPDNWKNDNDNIVSASIGGIVSGIGDYAFFNCSGLTSITIPNSVTTIGSNTFNICTSLTNVTIPNSVTTIGSYAFFTCTSLTNVTIPNSVTTIDSYAFGYCPSLDNVTIPNSVTTIGSYAFLNCSSLTNVTIPNSVTTIGSYAFGYCYGVNSMTIGSGVTTIGSRAFSYCGMSSIIIPNSVTSIGSGAFYGCNELGSIIIPNSITTIEASTFSICVSLTSITIPNSITTIGDYAFSFTSLTSVTIPNTITNMGDGVFYYTNSLNTLYCHVTKTILDQPLTLFNTATPFTIYARASDTTWTAGVDMIGGQSVTVIKNL